jgi:predicted Rossmann fold nucleotide-binding protein DprA/Smf involved in DNA uptake
MLGLLCSVKCPGDLVLKTYDTARVLRDAGVTVIGGFHSPMEKECLDLLLRGKQAVVICPARSVQDMRVPAEWRASLADGRLLVLSAFETTVRRVTKDTARQRNAFIAAIAKQILVPHASSGGEVESLCRGLFASGKTLYTFESAANSQLLTLGARTFDVRNIEDLM